MVLYIALCKLLKNDWKTFDDLRGVLTRIQVEERNWCGITYVLQTKQQKTKSGKHYMYFSRWSTIPILYLSCLNCFPDSPGHMIWWINFLYPQKQNKYVEETWQLYQIIVPSVRKADHLTLSMLLLLFFVIKNNHTFLHILQLHVVVYGKSNPLVTVAEDRKLGKLIAILDTSSAQCQQQSGVCSVTLVYKILNLI